MLVKKLKNEDLLKYEENTRDYGILKFAPQIQKKIKIRYNNPDEIDKDFEISSTSNDIIYVRKKELHIESKAGEFIRLTINAPKTIGKYIVSIVIKNKANNTVEEVLRFHIQVDNS